MIWRSADEYAGRASLDCARPTDALPVHTIATPSPLAAAMQVFLWLLLFSLVAGGSVLLVTWWRARQRKADRWGQEEADRLAAWDKTSLGISEVRVAERVPESPAPLTIAPVPTVQATPASGARASTPEADVPRAERASADRASADRASADRATPTPAPPASGADDFPSDPPAPVPTSPPLSPLESARPMRSRPEWWDDGASGAGALLRSLVDVTGGSAAILRPSERGYVVLAAAGAASAAIHANAGAREISERDARLLADVPTGLETVVLGGDEAGLLPGMTDVAETAVRSLRAAPGAPCLVVDVTHDAPLTSRGETLIAAYADLAARVLDLPEDAPAESASGDPLDAAMARIEREIAAARDQGRELSLAVVIPHNAEEILEGEPDEVDAHMAALHQRLLETSGTREVVSMGEGVLGALCEVKRPGAEAWVRALTRGGAPVRIGIAVYGPRHVTPSMLRQDALQALHQTYTSNDTYVISD